jgi:hypothetical protein
VPGAPAPLPGAAPAGVPAQTPPAAPARAPGQAALSSQTSPQPAVPNLFTLVPGLPPLPNFGFAPQH